MASGTPAQQTASMCHVMLMWFHTCLTGSGPKLECTIIIDLVQIHTLVLGFSAIPALKLFAD